MREGSVVQIGTADELWARPVDEDTARFLGLGNVREGTIDPTGSRGRHSRRTRRAEMAWSKPSRDAARPSRVVVRLDTGEMLRSAVAALDHPSPETAYRSRSTSEGVVPLDRADNVA